MDGPRSTHALAVAPGNAVGHRNADPVVTQSTIPSSRPLLLPPLPSVDPCLGLGIACLRGLSVSLRRDPVEKVAQQDDDHPTQEPNRPIGDGERQHGEGRAHDESEKDGVEEELTGPACPARGAAMPKDQSGQEAKSEPTPDDQAGRM